MSETELSVSETPNLPPTESKRYGNEDVFFIGQNEDGDGDDDGLSFIL